MAYKGAHGFPGLSCEIEKLPTKTANQGDLHSKDNCFTVIKFTQY